MAQIYIIAIPVDATRMGGRKMGRVRRSMQNRADNNTPRYHYVGNYLDSSDLFARVRVILDADPTHCLKQLEINAHGNPGRHDGIENLTFTGYIRDYKALKDRLCDETNILFTGCNTGLQPKSKNRDSIAERFAAALPYNTTDFNIHLTVWGTAGYCKYNTTAMERTIEVTRNKSLTRHYGAYPGGRNATGRSAWNSFRNW